MIIDIDMMIIMKKRISELNSKELSDITFIKGGKDVFFTKEQIDHWDFTGLNNIDFLLNNKPQAHKDNNNE